MRYLIVKGCQWRDCTLYGIEGQTVDESDLKADGQPLPAEVLSVFVEAGCLQPIEGE